MLPVSDSLILYKTMEKSSFPDKINLCSMTIYRFLDSILLQNESPILHVKHLVRNNSLHLKALSPCQIQTNILHFFFPVRRSLGYSFHENAVFSMNITLNMMKFVIQIKELDKTCRIKIIL